MTSSSGSQSRLIIRAGDRVKVIAEGDGHSGEIGQVHNVMDGADGMNVFVKFPSDEDLYAFSAVELRKQEPRQKNAGGGSKKAASEPRPPLFNVQVGRRVRVVADGDERYGQVGEVVALMDGADDMNVFVRFEDDDELYAFSRDELNDPKAKIQPKRRPRRPEPPSTPSSPPQTKNKPATSPAEHLWPHGKSLSEMAGPEAVPVGGSAEMSWRQHALLAWRALPVFGRIALLGVPAVLLGLVVVIFGFANSSQDAEDSTQADGPSTSDEWRRVVCQPGTYFNGADVLRNSTGSAVCTSLNGVPMGIATYSSNFDLENDVAVYRGGSYAVTTTTDGNLYVFVPLTGSAGGVVQTSLAPLLQYGFRILPIA
ncbi:hypothetical protein [Mycobacterium sp. PSTR-4-N]|uniref:hypothetical protein n=1 Tax=Mycobacterium sp. PSTR-4-N TaxID=2917745 RepID=UPI001F154CDD|nr:hypothetical protein [Mycobacterium sp. PSTR-4-N]MCG7594571.1 hypothetical protein [Mycobacterium sp. PSTR-4-N]